MGALTLSRHDRNVRNCRLNVGPAAPVHKLAFTTEEALRLCALPGEEEGRVYFFRRVHITGLPENGNRSAWLDAFQRALLECARNAVHGRNANAFRADAIFFHSDQQACEALLDRIVHRQPLNAWFWPSVSESPADASAAMHAVGAVRRLSRSRASWLSVAAAVFALSDPRMLLTLIPEGKARVWLRQLTLESGDYSAAVKPIALGSESLQVMARAAAGFGGDDPRVIWLCALAVILASPIHIDSGLAVSHARAVLKAFAPAAFRAEPNEALIAVESPRPAQKREQASPENEASASALPQAVHAARTREDENPDISNVVRARGVALAHTAVRPNPIGESTEGAGLYFLLNVLSHLNFPRHGFTIQFLAHLLIRVASHAGICPDDPVLFWAARTIDEAQPEEIDERFLRIWMRKVRRWCWRNGKIGLRAIVRRPGRVTLTRTDLDVRLSLDSADVRIRRIGLDLDPGWLPWFGRVVRFHYIDRGEWNA